MKSLTRAFGYGMLAGLVGMGLHWLWTFLMDQDSKPTTGLAADIALTSVLQLALAAVSSAIGVLIGFKLSPGVARQAGILPGLLLGLAFWSMIPDIRMLPLFLLSLSPGLASGGAALVKAGETASRRSPPPPA